MSPQETADLEVRSLGPCPHCGQEQLLRTRALVDCTTGIRIEVRRYTDCGCGLALVEPEEPQPP